ncbi:hypothetical protein SNEBB_007336 [Seison nebaliae]|nr:hypothetical protein SNEBB_007336 [Seison nebaliae]
MRILVGVKRVIDYAVKVQVKPNGLGVVTQGVKHSMNPFDEIAIEEAIRLKEKKIAKEVICVTCGPTKSQETLRNALALGADRAIHCVVSEEENEKKLQPIHVAKVLSKIAENEKVDMLIVGKQAIDDDSSHTAAMAAGYLRWPQATCASEVKIDGKSVQITREVDGGLQTLKMDLPCVFSSDLRLNEPRYATLPNIMKAKKKPMKKTSLSELDIKFDERQTNLGVSEPPKRSVGIKLESVDELIDKLKSDGLIK